MDNPSYNLYRLNKYVLAQLPGTAEFFKKWTNRGEKNQSLFEEVFAILPSDKVHSMPHGTGKQAWDDKSEDYIKWQARYENRMSIKDPQAALERIKDLEGYLVSFPLHFLEDETKITDLHSLLKNLSLGTSLYGLLSLFLSDLFE